MNKKLLLLIVMIIVIGLLDMINAQELNVNSSKFVYQPNDLLEIFGTATPNSILTIIINNPNNMIVAIDQIKSDGTGHFYSTPLRFPPQQTSSIPFGDYFVYIKDSSTGRETTLKVVFASAAIIFNGVVLDINGKPLKDASVTLLTPRNTSKTIITSVDGRFSFEESDVGKYMIKTVALGYHEEVMELMIDYAPSQVSLVISMNKPRLWIENFTLMLDNKMFIGYAREGEELKASLQVYYAGQQVYNAKVVGKAVCSTGGDFNLNFTYDSTQKSYIASAKIPVINQDRICRFIIEATYAGLTQTIESNITVLMSVIDVQTKLLLIEEKLKQLELNLNQSINSTYALQARINELQNIVASINDTMIIAELKRINDTLTIMKKTLDEYALKEDLNDVQLQLLTQISQIHEQISLLQKAIQVLNQNQSNNVLQIIGVVLGVIALLVALLSIVYVYRKIAI